MKAEFDTDGGVSVSVSGLGGNPSEGEYELSLALIGALVKECDINKNGGIIDKVTIRI